MRLAGASHVGNSRSDNQDDFGIDAARSLAVVADGMGGLAHGAAASRIVVDSVLAACAGGGGPADGLQQAHARIRAEGDQAGGERMGSTAVSVSICGGEAVIDWAGDSRAYLFRAGALRQLTTDHSLVQRLLDLNAITPDEALDHPHRHVITRGVGIGSDERLASEQLRLVLQPGDRLLLCTDGLSGYLSPPQMEFELRTGGSCEDIARRLVQRTLDETEAADNITVVCIEIEESHAR